MAMSWIWVIMVGLSLLFGWQNGTIAEVSAAAGTGAQSAVELCVSMAGPLCLWTGVMAVLRESGGLEKLSGLLRPVLGRLYPAFRGDDTVMESISANVSARDLAGSQ